MTLWGEGPSHDPARTTKDACSSHQRYYRPNVPVDDLPKPASAPKVGAAGAPKPAPAGAPNAPGVDEAPKVGAAGAPKLKPVCAAPNAGAEVVVPNPFPAGDPKVVVAGVLVAPNAGAAETEPKAGAAPNPLLFWATGAPKVPTAADPNGLDVEFEPNEFEVGAPKAGADVVGPGEPNAAGVAAADPKADGPPNALAGAGAPKAFDEAAPKVGAPVVVWVDPNGDGAEGAPKGVDGAGEPNAPAAGAPKEF